MRSGDDAPVGESTRAEGDVSCAARVVELGPRGHIATGIPFLDHLIDQLTSHAQLGVSLTASIGGVPCVPEVDYANRADASGPETGEEAAARRHDRSICAAAGASLGSAAASLLRTLGGADARAAPPSRFLAPLDEAVAEVVIGRGSGTLTYSVAPFGAFPREGRVAVGTLRLAHLEAFWAGIAVGLECDLTVRKARTRSVIHSSSWVRLRGANSHPNRTATTSAHTCVVHPRLLHDEL